MKMKKIALFIVCLSMGVAVSAQDLVNKKGENFLPEEGEWAVGFDAHPFLEYIGNIFSDGFNFAPEANYLNNVNTIYGKMFISPTKAYRAKARIGFNNTTDNVSVFNLEDPAGDNLEDTRKVSSTFVGLGAGIENRRGNSRLQGVWGAEGFVWFGGSKTTYEYGNPLDATNNPFHVNSFNPGFDDGVTEIKGGSVVGVQVRGFIGVEYFVIPKISLGAEYGWGPAFQSTGDSEVSVEFLNADSEVESETTSAPGGSSFSLDTDINNSAFGMGTLGDMSLKVLFHF